MNISSRMAGFGHYAPKRKVDNYELENQLGLDRGWIEKRTGILSRRWAEPEETLTDMAEKAGRMALDDAGIDSTAVALTLLATSTPDHLLPPSAPLLAFRLGLHRSGAINLTGACSGFLYALALADSFVRVHNQPVLVVAANILSRRINMKDRNTAAVFADAAGAVVLVPSLSPGSGMIGVDLIQEGQSYDLIQIPAGGSARPLKPDYDANVLHIVMRSGKTVFANAVRMMSQSSERALKNAELAAKDVNRLVPHQANARIIDTICDLLGFAPDIAVNSIREYGNSSAATIPLSLSLSNKKSPFRPGERLLLTAAGAGMAGGAIVWKHSV